MDANNNALDKVVPETIPDLDPAHPDDELPYGSPDESSDGQEPSTPPCSV